MSGFRKNVTGQKWRVYAFDRTDNTSKTGDAANITAKIAKDDGTATALGDTNPTETEDGFYLFDLTQAETNADKLSLYPESSTADIQVVGSPAEVFTVPDNFQELGIESDGDLTKVNTVDGLTASNLDVAVSTRSSHTAANVWTSTTRTLTSFGTLAADVWTHGTRTLTSFGTLVADVWTHATRTLTALVSGAATEAKQDTIIANQGTHDGRFDTLDAGQAVIDSNVASENAATRTQGGAGPWTQGNTTAPLTSQATRDSMKLAPSAGAPDPGSIDEELDTIISTGGPGPWTTGGGGGGGTGRAIKGMVFPSGSDWFWIGSLMEDGIVVTTGITAPAVVGVFGQNGGTSLGYTEVTAPAVDAQGALYGSFTLGTAPTAGVPAYVEVTAVHETITYRGRLEVVVSG